VYQAVSTAAFALHLPSRSASGMLRNGGRRQGRAQITPSQAIASG